MAGGNREAISVFTLCVGVGPSQPGAVDGPDDLLRAAARWDQLGLEQLVAGECELPHHPRRRRFAEIGTTSNDQPLLADLLRCAAEAASHGWLLLVSGDLLLSRMLVNNLAQLCRSESPHRLVIGRAWRLGRDRLASLSMAADPETAQQRSMDTALQEAIDQEGCLDGPERPAWVLLPRGALLAAPAQLSCDPAQALPWLVEAAGLLGWPVLEATAAAPVARPELPGGTTQGELIVEPTGVVLPHAPGAPLLSLLLAAPERQLQRLVQALSPAPALPWEVVARPAEPAGDPGAVTAAWNSALTAARGELAWPITDQLPPLALIPVVLRSFEQPGADLLLLSWEVNGLAMPPGLAWHQQPGCLVAHSRWLRRVGAFRESLPAAAALLQVRRQAERRGARSRCLPISALPPAAAA